MKIVSKTGRDLVSLEIERCGLVLLPSRIGVDRVRAGDTGRKILELVRRQIRAGRKVWAALRTGVCSAVR